MKNMKLFTKWMTALLAVILTLSLICIPVLADDGTNAPETTSEPETTTEPETTSEPETTTEPETTADTTEETTADTTTETEEDDNNIVGIIVGIAIGVVVVAVAVFLCIKYREKIGKFLRTYKSELKKVTWFSWENTKKNSIVAIIVLLVCAIVITLLDLGLNKGFLGLLGLLD